MASPPVLELPTPHRAPLGLPAGSVRALIALLIGGLFWGLVLFHERAVEIPDDVPRVHAVGAELNQVWMNLLDNAIDAVDKGGHVTVRASRERERVVVGIIDDGPGVPKEIQGRIFDPFFTTKGVGEGTGLGLDIVRRLLQRHDGEISLDSEPGRTEFQVRLEAER